MSFGITISDSTSSKIMFAATNADKLQSVIGKMVTLEILINEERYRCVGTVTDIITRNTRLRQDSPEMSIAIRESVGGRTAASDIRYSSFAVQAVFVYRGNAWHKASSSLPISPPTGAPVELLDEDVAKELIQGKSYPTIGYYRGLEGVPQPFDLQNFSSSRGATHSGIYGKTGSGKDLALDTPIPTPDGWKTMGEIKTGDYVFDDFGEETLVLKAHDILSDSACYKIGFCNENTIVAGGGHLWDVVKEIGATEFFQVGLTPSISFLEPDEYMGVRHAADQVDTESVTTLEQALLDLGLSKQRNHSWPLLAALEIKSVNDSDDDNIIYSTQKLYNALAEYGSRELVSIDGRHYVKTIKTTEEIWEHLHNRAEKVYIRLHNEKLEFSVKSSYNVDEFLDAIRNTPEVLQLEDTLLSIKSREEIIRSLTDKGTVDTITIPNDNPAAQTIIQSILHSLGYNTRLGLINEITYNRSPLVQITSAELVETVLTRCLTVDSPASLFLAGETYIPTHNTAMSNYLLAAQMKNESHTIAVIDPQGQWSNENGMVMSLQNFAKGLGKEVHVLRISEDLALPLEEELLQKIVNKVNLWKKFRRMGTENRDMFSEEVASRLCAGRHNLDGDAKDILSEVFKKIAQSQSSLNRIYVKGERQDEFKRSLLLLAGITPTTEDGETEIIEQEEWDDADENWTSILSYFRPVQSLFSTKNLSGGPRKPISGDTGIMSQVFSTQRQVDGSIAPYFVFDMSPSIALNAKNRLLSNSDSELYMQKMLDNSDIKALILMSFLEEMKKAAETAFGETGTLLDTQIVFDEAWRFAPAKKSTPEIDALADMLEGFALDTRKFGIGWTYILQTPDNLRPGITGQFSYVYAGWGLVGDNVKRLEALTDDASQVGLYKQFITPSATQEYPFMVLGSISPIIFTTAPAFINIFTDKNEFLKHNKKWIDDICERRSLPKITEEFMGRVVKRKELKATKEVAEKVYKVGKNAEAFDNSKPQSVEIKARPEERDPFGDPEQPW